MKLALRLICAIPLILPCTALAQESAGSELPLPLTLDEQLVQIAEQVPGFGGVHHDWTTGRFIVHLKDLSQASAARRAVGAFLFRRPVLPGVGEPKADAPRTARRRPLMAFTQAEHDFRDLARWRRQLEEAGRDLWTMSDIDDIANRVLIGVIDEAARVELSDALEGLGIPPGAVTIRVIPPAVEENLQGFARPVRGGIQVKAVPGPTGTGGECTLSYVALREFPGQVYDFAGPRYVFTASHCAPPFGVDQDNVIGQPTQAERIGVEFSDPPLRSNASDPACPSASNVCRRSDAALFLLDDNSSATSTFNGVATASGLTLTGTTFYAGRQQSFWSNQSVTKIGRTTGQTSGGVSNSCVNLSIDGRTMVCQVLATYASSPGDSGAPVWHTDNLGNRWLIGLHWGRAGGGGWAVFSFRLDAYVEVANDVLARTGVQWGPAVTTGPIH